MTHSSFQSLAHAVETYYDELRQFIRQRTGSASLAEEVLQETWIRASTTTAALPENPRAYLYRMAGNLAVDQARRDNARERVIVDADGADSEDSLVDRVASQEPDPQQAAITHQELDALNAAVRELPEKCRHVFLLYRGHGLSMREVAAHLDISEKTVEKHIARAMVHCRMRLREAGRNV